MPARKKGFRKGPSDRADLSTAPWRHGIETKREKTIECLTCNKVVEKERVSTQGRSLLSSAAGLRTGNDLMRYSTVRRSTSNEEDACTAEESVRFCGAHSIALVCRDTLKESGSDRGSH